MTLAAGALPAAAGIVQRRLAAPADPLALYAALAAGRPDTALFEGMNGPTLLMQRAALRIECRGERVRMAALTANGESLLRSIAQACTGAVTERGDQSLTLHLPHSRSLDPAERLLAPSPLEAVRAALRAALAEAQDDAFGALALGVVAFDYAAAAEGIAGPAADPLGFPDFVFWVPDALLLFEGTAPPRLICAAFGDDDPQRAARNHHDAVARLTRLAEACAAAAPLAPGQARPAAPGRIEADLDDAGYCEVVRRMKAEIAAGEIYQVVPSRTFRARCADQLAAYAALRQLEPGSYRFFVQGDGFTLFGASPETSVRVTPEQDHHQVEVRPIAGTRPRGASADADNRLEAEMRLDGKELAEHMMLVDLARNDVARISAPGTRKVARLLTVERYARVMHLVSSVTGRLRPGLDALHALAACLNVGTLSGAPKIRATALLAESEQTRRGPYGGAVGWLNGAGTMDTAVVIRSAFVQDGIAHVRAGAGIVHDSDPQAEADETRRKASALLSVLAGAGGGGQ